MEKRRCRVRWIAGRGKEDEAGRSRVGAELAWERVLNFTPHSWLLLTPHQRENNPFHTPLHTRFPFQVLESLADTGF